MEAEQVFLRTQGWLVTRSRIEINGQTFATRNVSSVRVEDEDGSLAGILIAILGAALAASEHSRWFGIALLVLGAYLIVQKLRERKLVLVTGGGEQIALKSTDPDTIEQLRAAIAAAISVR
jgi:hypothetical protein